MIRVGLFGASGYTGFETLHYLQKHPQVALAFATSESMAGQNIRQAYPTGLDIPLVAAAEADLSAVDAVFCCLPHAASMPTVVRALEAGVRVVDLSADFRLQDPAVYEAWYKTPHSATEHLAQAVYGLPELNRPAIAETDLLANPGCYPTSILLALLPLLQEGWLAADQPVISDSKSGVSGAGRKPSLKTHFVEVNENLAPYNIGQVHRHTAEIKQTMQAFTRADLIFSPHLIPISRGMLSTIYITLGEGHRSPDLQTLFESTYAHEPFVRILPPGELATFAHTQRSNDCVISITPVDEQRAILCSSIDNLGKGAAGQAVQNFNLMFGLDETLALR